MSSGLTRKQKRALKRQGHQDPTGHPPPGGVSAVGWSFRSGPLPDAKELVEYDAVVPGAAKLIVEKFGLQSDHRRDLESTVVKGNDRRADRGQWMAYTIALVAILGGIYLLAHDKDTGGLVTIITAVVGLVTAFITGKVFQAKERREKRQGG